MVVSAVQSLSWPPSGSLAKVWLAGKEKGRKEGGKVERAEFSTCLSLANREREWMVKGKRERSVCA